ncbi:MAG: flagellar M-ring protein FliF, partial [Rhodobacteraceae bacterium]|nr:flagellar M-ring protein FliF [Paracoccaceae bacterium]
LVQSAIGFDSERGDIVTLKSMSFEPVEVIGTPSQGALPSLADVNLMTLIQLAIFAIVAIVLAVFVLRPLLSRARETPSLPRPSDAPQVPSPNAPALTGEIQDGDEAYAAPEQSDPNLPAVSKATETTAEADPVERLRALIADRQEETVEILRSWLDEPREHT